MLFWPARSLKERKVEICRARELPLASGGPATVVFSSSPLAVSSEKVFNFALQFCHCASLESTRCFSPAAKRLMDVITFKSFSYKYLFHQRQVKRSMSCYDITPEKLLCKRKRKKKPESTETNTHTIIWNRDKKIHSMYKHMNFDKL